MLTILKLNQQRVVKLKCSIDQTKMLNFLPLYPTKCCYWKVFSLIFNNISEQNSLNKFVINNVNRLNHSSLMNNTVTNKIKHFPQLFQSSGAKYPYPHSHTPICKNKEYIYCLKIIESGSTWQISRLPTPSV